MATKYFEMIPFTNSGRELLKHETENETENKINVKIF
jgi:hypothetical protein